MYELTIIGAGPAGITAAVYAARKKISTLVITQDIGGQTAWSGDIENYTGYQFITGPDLAAKFEEHMRKYDIHLKENELATDITKQDKTFLIKTNKSSFESRAVIIASGKKSRELDCPGEKEFKNKGLTYCATCDGPLFANKTVAVIGGGNSALDACLGLIKIAKHIYLININDKLSGEAIMRDKVLANKKITVYNNSQVSAILGTRFLEAIKIKRMQPQRPQNATAETAEETLNVSGVFVEIGLIPNSGFAHLVDLNDFGEIKINNRNETNIPGVFAAGDVTDVPEKQIVIAAGEGAKSALSAFNYLAKLN